MTSKNLRSRVIVLDGNSLTPEDLYAIGYGTNVFIKISDDAIKRVKEGREVGIITLTNIFLNLDNVYLLNYL